MTILALDLGSKLGWAVRMPDGDVIYGTEVFTPRRFESGEMRWVRFRSWLGEICYKSKCRRIVFEEVRGHKGTMAAQIYGGFVGHLEHYCHGTLIPCSPLTVGEIKKFATGKGNAGKPAMIAAMKNRGFDPKDDNAADALAILLCAESQEKRESV